MSRDFALLLRGFGKFLAVVIGCVLAVLVGVGLGAGLSKLTRDKASDRGEPVAAVPASRTSGASGASGASQAAGANADQSQRPSIRVLASTFESSTTLSGQQRRRARVAVRLRVTARGSDATLGTARLSSGATRLRSDPAAARLASDLFDRIPAGESATGELRFETSGAVTDRLAAQQRATLRIDNRLLPLRLTPVLPRLRLTPP